jgi:phage baseplate assembly protein V
MELRDWQRLTQTFLDRIGQLLGYGKLSLLDSETPLQQAQFTLLDDQVLGDVEVWEPYGFTSTAKPGAETLVAQVAGQRGNEVVIAISDRRFRLTGLASGEVALYTDEGDKLHFKRGKVIEINSGNEIDLMAASKITVTAPEIDATATTQATLTSPIVEVTAATSATVICGASVFTVTPALISCKAPAITLDGPVTCTNTLEVAGGITGTGGLAVSGGAGATVAGNFAVTGGDVTADGKSLQHHVHPGDSGGTTGEPE